MIVNTFKAGVGIIACLFGYNAICSSIAKAKVYNHKKNGKDDLDYEDEFENIRHDPGRAFTGWISSEKVEDKKED